VKWRGIRALQGASAAFPQAACSLIALDMPSVLELPAGIVLRRALDCAVEWGGEGGDFLQ
jgi:hypothetical protein